MLQLHWISDVNGSFLVSINGVVHFFPRKLLLPTEMDTINFVYIQESHESHYDEEPTNPFQLPGFLDVSWGRRYLIYLCGPYCSKIVYHQHADNRNIFFNSHWSYECCLRYIWTARALLLNVQNSMANLLLLSAVFVLISKDWDYVFAVALF